MLALAVEYTYIADGNLIEAYVVGDMNCDGALNTFDVDPFVLALTDPGGYEAAYPECDRMLADIDGSGAVNTFDIDPFVALLTGKQPPRRIGESGRLRPQSARSCPGRSCSPLAYMTLVLWVHAEVPRTAP